MNGPFEFRAWNGVNLFLLADLNCNVQHLISGKMLAERIGSSDILENELGNFCFKER